MGIKSIFFAILVVAVAVVLLFSGILPLSFQQRTFIDTTNEPNNGKWVVYDNYAYAQRFTVPEDISKLTYLEFEGFLITDDGYNALIGISQTLTTDFYKWMRDSSGAYGKQCIDIKSSSPPRWNNLNLLVLPGGTYYAICLIYTSPSVKFMTTAPNVISGNPCYLNEDDNFMEKTNQDLKIRIDGEYQSDPEPPEPGDDVTCYRCNGQEVESDTFEGECPSGWAETPPSCGGSPTSNPPTINSIAGPASFEVLQSTSFSISGYEPDGDSVEYKFDWGDGSESGWSSQSTMSHSYEAYGSYTIIGYIKDSDGQDSKSKNIEVEGIRLQAPKINYDTTLKKGEVTTATIEFEGSESTDAYDLQAYVEEANGNFLINKWTEFSKENGKITISFEPDVNGELKIGGMAISRNHDIYISSNEVYARATVSADGTQEKIHECEVTFRVKTLDDVPIAGASVLFDGQQKSTNEYGDVSFTVYSGQHEFTVSKDGMKSRTAAVEVTDQKTVTVNIQMAEEGSTKQSKYNLGGQGPVIDLSTVSMGAMVFAAVIFFVGALLSLLFLPGLSVKIIGVLISLIIAIIIVATNLGGLL